MDELLDSFQEAWSGRRRGAFAAVCAPDLHWTDPLGDGPLYGPEALADRAATLWKAFPDASLESAGERLASERFVAAPVLFTGTHKTSIGPIPATGRRITVHALLYCELDPPRERLWRVRAFFDTHDAAIQLGVMPERGSLGERAILLVRGFGLRRQGADEVEGGD